jgi:hypothetical protein
MDPEKMKNFKRIILGRYNYREIDWERLLYQIDGRIEYYTSGGNHPVEVTRPLKPLSLICLKNICASRKTPTRFPSRAKCEDPV